MVPQAGKLGIRELSPAEVVRIVKWRFRICGYIFNLGAIWLGLGAVVLALGALYHRRQDMDATWMAIAIVLEAVGLAIFTLGLAMTFAMYRCPVCDTYLSRFRPDKLRCSSCNAQVRQAE